MKGQLLTKNKKLNPRFTMKQLFVKISNQISRNILKCFFVLFYCTTTKVRDIAPRISFFNNFILNKFLYCESSFFWPNLLLFVRWTILVFDRRKRSRLTGRASRLSGRAVRLGSISTRTGSTSGSAPREKKISFKDYATRCALQAHKVLLSRFGK